MYKFLFCVIAHFFCNLDADSVNLNSIYSYFVYHHFIYVYL